MSDLDELASAGRRFRSPTPGMRPGSWSPGEAFTFGFFAGIGIWFAFVLCTLVAWLILRLAGEMNHRAADPTFGYSGTSGTPTAQSLVWRSPSA